MGLAPKYYNKCSKYLNNNNILKTKLIYISSILFLIYVIKI